MAVFTSITTIFVFSGFIPTGFFMKKMPLVVIFTTSMLSGCAVTPIGALQSTYTDTRGTTPLIFSSSGQPGAATACVMNNIDNKYAQFMPMLGPLTGKSNGSEIRVRSSEAGMAAVIEVQEDSAGSAISVWISNHYVLFKDTIANRIAGGC